MRYQLVLKFQCDPLADFRRMVALMDALTDALADSADIDDHYFGSNGMNIFIWTADPGTAFERTKPVLQSRHQLDRLKAAYRAKDGKRYTVIWPEAGFTHLP